MWLLKVENSLLVISVFSVKQETKSSAESEGDDFGNLWSRSKDEIVTLGIEKMTGLRRDVCLPSTIKGSVEFGKVRAMSMIVYFSPAMFQVLSCMRRKSEDLDLTRSLCDC